MSNPAPLPSWITLYELALLETDERQFSIRVSTAIQAVTLRLEELRCLPDSSNLKEQHAICDALHTLRVLRGEK